MEAWFVVLISLCISALIKSLIHLLSPKERTIQNLPPGPSTIDKLTWITKSMSERAAIIRNLHAKYGPVVRFHGSIFVTTHSSAHQALIQNGATFAGRPPSPPTVKIINSDQHTINATSYGQTWRLLRRNLTSEILHPSRVKAYSSARKRVLNILTDSLKSLSKSGDPISMAKHFEYAMFCISAFMCFGDEIEEEKIKEIEHVDHSLILSLGKFHILNFFPKLGKILFSKRWEELLRLRQNQEDVMISIINDRKKAKQQNSTKPNEDFVTYVDTLFDLQLPEEKRKLEDGEIVSLCSEFLNAGADTTSAVLQWIMAYLVKYPHIQEKLFTEINGVMGLGEKKTVGDEDLQKMPYLKTVILEGLRLHPPLQSLLTHLATEDVMLEGYMVPKNSTVHFMVSDLGRDPKVWEDPMMFKPERFLISDENGNKMGVFDLTKDLTRSTTKEIKMMPFGAGRRMCPGYALGIHHLEYFVANLVWYFKWTAVDGEGVDLTEQAGVMVVMKNPLRAHVSPRLTT